MKIRTLLAAAIVAGVTTSLSHAAENANYSEALAIYSAEQAGRSAKSGKKESPNLLRDLLRGGRPADKNARISTDNITTASISGAAAKPRAAVKASKRGAKSKSGAKAKGGSYQTIIARYASAYGVPVSLANAIVRVESNYRANARGAAGEIGLMQIKPATARMMGYRGSAKGLYHPDTNIKYGMKYLAKAHRLSGGTTCGTVLRYNAGHGAKRMNPISSAYCSKVKRILGR